MSLSERHYTFGKEGRKRKSKERRRMNGAGEDDALAHEMQHSPLNPHIQLRRNLVTKGFSIKEIDNAIEVMWERELPYDNVSEVLRFLEAPNSGKEVPPVTSQREQEPSLNLKETPEEETKTASTAESSAESSGRRREQEYAIKESEHQNDDDECDESDEFDVEREAIEQLTQQRKSSGHPLNIASKLDLVADFENLADAIFALSEWITKAAGVEEINAFCSTQKSRALSTVIRRTIAENLDATKFEESALPAILHLIGSLFLNAGMSSTAVSTTRKSLENVMKRARKSSIAKEDTEQIFADRVAIYIVSRIAKAVQELSVNVRDEHVGLILRLEDEIESLASSIHTGEGGVAELIAKRDANKTAAEKASTVFGVAMATSFRGIDMVTPHDDAAEVIEKEDILVSLIGRSATEQIDDNFQRHTDLKKKVSTVVTDTDEQSSKLRSDLATFSSERALIAERMVELREALRQLEEDDAELCEKINETEERIARLDATCVEEVDQLNEELNATAAVISVDDSVGSLADGLKVYEESLQKAVTVSNIFENCENLNEFITSKLGVYLVYVKNYFSSETECIEFLRVRVKNLRTEARDLKREIDECEALGMTATVSQLMDALSLNRQNISDDSAVLDCLINESQNMITSLLGRLDQFLFSESFPGQELTQLHLTLLRGIIGTVELMGLGEVEKLKSFLPRNSDDMPIVVTTSHEEDDTDFELATDDDTCNDIAFAREKVRRIDAAVIDAQVGSVVEEKSDLTTETTVHSQDHEDTESSVDHDSSQLRNASIHGGDKSSKRPDKLVQFSSQQTKPNVDPLTPKLTWAKGASTPKKGAIKSLREIQREELSSRETKPGGS